MYSTRMTTAEQSPTPGFLVYRLATKWQAAVDRAVSPFGITHAQYSVLASLRGMTRGGRRPSQREVADRLGLDPVFVSKLVRTLEQNGLVERNDHPTDARAFALGLTDAGIRTIDPAIKVVLALQDELTAPLGGLSSKATAQFVGTVQKLLAATIPDHHTPEGRQP